MKLSLFAVAVCALCLTFGAHPASSYPTINGTGLTKVERQLDGTVTMAGSFEWAGCPLYCNWLPIVTMQPSLPSYSCKPNDLLASDSNIRHLWNPGGQRAVNGAVSLDFTGLIDPLPYMTDVRACLHIMTAVPAPPQSYPFGGVFVTRAMPVTPPPAPTTDTSKAKRRAKAIRKCKRIRNAKKRKRCIRIAKRKYR